MGLTSVQRKQVERFTPLIKVVDHNTAWVTDGIVMYKVSPEDEFTKPFDKVFNVENNAQREGLFGSINTADEIAETGFTLDMHIDGVKKNVCILTCKSGSNISLFLVDDQLIKKVRPRSADGRFVVGVRKGERVLYNQEQTIGVMCVKDEMLAKVLENYDEMFQALSVIRKMGGVSLSN